MYTVSMCILFRCENKTMATIDVVPILGRQPEASLLLSLILTAILQDKNDRSHDPMRSWRQERLNWAGGGPVGVISGIPTQTVSGAD